MNKHEQMGIHLDVFLLIKNMEYRESHERRAVSFFVLEKLWVASMYYKVLFEI